MDPQIHRSWFVFCLICTSIFGQIRAKHAGKNLRRATEKRDVHPDVDFYPESLNAAIGRPFDLVCVLSENFVSRTGLNSSFITFETEDCPENTEAVILDERRSQITFPSPHIVKHMECYIHCLVNATELHIESDHMFVGYLPMPVKSIEEIRCNNWKDGTLVFRTNNSNMVYHDHYLLTYGISSGNHSFSNTSTSTSECYPDFESEDWTEDGLFICDFDLNSFHLDPDSVLKYQVFGSNDAGNYSSSTYTTPLSSIIELGAVTNLAVLPLTAFSISVCFDQDAFFPPNAVFIVDMASKYSSITVNLSTTSLRMCHNFTSLYSFVEYKMRIRPYYKSSIYHNQGEILEARFQMPKSAPRAFPETSSSCFAVNSLQPSVREVVVFWKPLPHQLIGAHILDYEITRVCGSRLQKFRTESNFYIFHEMPSHLACLVFVQAENEKGFYDGKTMKGVHIPAQNQLLREVQNLTALMQKNRSLVQLTWTYDQMVKISSFTVYFCYGYEQCENDISWIHLGSESREASVHIPKSWPMKYHSWLIGISADGAQGLSTGISWIPCLYSADKRPPKPSFSVIERGTTKVRIEAMQPQCSKSLEGYVYGYSIGFCRSDGTQCTGKTKTLLHERVNASVLELRDLEPGAIYQLWGQSLSVDGPSFYNSTVVIFATEKEIFSPGPVIGMSISGILLVICLLFGIYTCCRRGQRLWKAFKRKLHIDIHRPSPKSIHRNLQPPPPLNISDLAGSYREEHRYVDIDDDGNEYIDQNINTARVFSPINNINEEKLVNIPMIMKKMEASETGSVENYPENTEQDPHHSSMEYLTGRTHVEHREPEFNVNDYASDRSEESDGSVNYIGEQQSSLLLDSLQPWDNEENNESSNDSNNSSDNFLLLEAPKTLNDPDNSEDGSVSSLILNAPVLDLTS